MAQIVLEVAEENLGAVLTVINSLKDGLIEKIDVATSEITNNNATPKQQQRHTRYQPKQNRVNYEEEQAELTSMGKYLDPAEFKKRLRQRQGR